MFFFAGVEVCSTVGSVSEKHDFGYVSKVCFCSFNAASFRVDAVVVVLVSFRRFVVIF